MRKGQIFICGLTCVMLAGCSPENQAAFSKKIVQTMPVITEEYEEGPEYLGIVMAKETKNYAFLGGGKLETLYVKEGDYISKGEPLAKLDTSSLELNIDTAKANVNGLKSALDTAKSALDASSVLYGNGDISVMAWKSQNSEYETLKGNYKTAVNSLEQAEKNLKDSTLYADSDGYVMELPFHEGEIIGAGYPAVVMKSDQKVVTIGVSADDISRVSKDSKVMIDGTIEAGIDKIGQYPDEKIRAYPVDVVFDSDACVIGDMVSVKIITEKKEGAFVPIRSLINIDGLDYVYIVDQDGLLSRRQVTRRSFIQDMVQIEGLEPGTMVVSEGVKDVKENDQVVLPGQEEENE